MQIVLFVYFYGVLKMITHHKQCAMLEMSKLSLHGHQANTSDPHSRPLALPAASSSANPAMHFT